MNLTTLHVDYWRERQREPRWMHTLLDEHARKQRSMFATNKRRSINVHSIVNANAGGLSKPHEATSFCHLMRLAYKNNGMAEIRAILQRCAGPNHYSTDSARRRGYARKWLQKLNRGHKQ